MVTNSASLEDNREFVDSTRHDDIDYVYSIIYDAIFEKWLDEGIEADDTNLEILETACKTALKEIEKIKGTKY